MVVGRNGLRCTVDRDCREVRSADGARRRGGERVRGPLRFLARRLLARNYPASVVRREPNPLAVAWFDFEAGRARPNETSIAPADEVLTARSLESVRMRCLRFVFTTDVTRRCPAEREHHRV